MIDENLLEYDNLTIAQKIFTEADSAGEIDEIFDKLKEYSQSRAESVAEYADMYAKQLLNDATEKFGVATSKKHIEKAVRDDLSFHRMKQMAQLCMNIYDLRGDSTGEPIKTAAEILYALPYNERNSKKGIIKTFHAVVDKTAEILNLPDDTPPAKSKKWGLGKKKPPTPGPQ